MATESDRVGSSFLGSLPRLGWLAVQYLLVAAIVYTFHLESAGFLRLLALCGVGFVVHHLLPARFRMPFFVLISLAVMPVVFTRLIAFWIVAGGGLLILLCHLPIRFGARVMLILVACGTLAAGRGEWLSLPIPKPAFPVLASLFMFRLAVYLYDLKHRTAPFGFWRAGAYFFMAPNLFFPLFPVVDYKTFCRTYYNGDAFAIYQKGIDWMFRGTVHLLGYRWVYQNLVIGLPEVVDAGSAARYVVATFLLYLKVSGTFHLAIGMLHLFGFHLPETHHRYMLASSFLDFWRRINIYWKDFIQKIVFYPVYFRVKAWGQTAALVTATCVAFIATWLLHSYQTFWLVGEFPLRAQDVVFWLALAVLVMANMIWDARAGKKRTLTKRALGWTEEAGRVGRTVGTFVLIDLLWSLWTSETFEHWWLVISAFANVSAMDAIAIAAGLCALGAAAIWFGRTSGERTPDATDGSHHGMSNTFFRPALQTALPAVLILMAGLFPAVLAVSPSLAGNVRELRNFQLNARDLETMQRGYYEKLTHDVRFSPELWQLHREKPADWVDSTNTELLRGSGTFAGVELVPSASEIYQGALLTTNRWGMRDREYEKKKEPGVYRIALLGASRSVGGGVEDHQTFEALIEERLNRERRGPDDYRYEILNFSVMSHGPLRKLNVLEKVAWDFKPDAVLFEAQVGEPMFAALDLARSLGFAEQEYPELYEIAKRANIDTDTERAAVRPRLLPYRDELLRWGFDRMARLCDEAGVPVILVLIPDFGEPPGGHRNIRSVVDLGKEHGFEVINLYESLRDFPDTSALKLAPWDNHPNVRGHRLIADETYRRLRPLLPYRP